MYRDPAKNIIDNVEVLKNFQKQFQTFTAYNNVLISIASAVCIGMATKEVITNIMNEILLPIIASLSNTSITYILYKKAVEHTKFSGFLNAIIIYFGKFIWIMLVWFLILYLTYVLFKTLIKTDLLTGKLQLLEDITRSFTKQEKKEVKQLIKQELPTSQLLSQSFSLASP